MAGDKCCVPGAIKQIPVVRGILPVGPDLSCISHRAFLDMHLLSPHHVVNRDLLDGLIPSISFPHWFLDGLEVEGSSAVGTRGVCGYQWLAVVCLEVCALLAVVHLPPAWD